MSAAARGRAKSRSRAGARGSAARSRSRRKPAQRGRAKGRRRTKAQVRTRRRRVMAGGVVAAVVGVLAVTQFGIFDKAVKEITLPLRHEDVIRAQSAEKGVDAALIAAVIYAESRFVDQTSSAGARGLMQIT